MASNPVQSWRLQSQTFSINIELARRHWVCKTCAFVRSYTRKGIAFKPFYAFFMWLYYVPGCMSFLKTPQFLGKCKPLLMCVRGSSDCRSGGFTHIHTSPSKSKLSKIVYRIKEFALFLHSRGRFYVYLHILFSIPSFFPFPSPFHLFHSLLTNGSPSTRDRLYSLVWLCTTSGRSTTVLLPLQAIFLYSIKKYISTHELINQKRNIMQVLGYNFPRYRFLQYKSGNKNININVYSQRAYLEEKAFYTSCSDLKN